MPFLSTLSLRRATHCDTLSALAPEEFLSTLSLRRATQKIENEEAKTEFLSTLSLRRATLICFGSLAGPSFLSTLSLRRATSLAVTTVDGPSNFYPRSPCGERLFDAMQIVIVVVFLSTLSLRRATPVRDIIQWEGIFLSTLSLRRATERPGQTAKANKDFYPRSPCGERRAIPADCADQARISIHALLAESDR